MKDGIKKWVIAMWLSDPWFAEYFIEDEDNACADEDKGLSLVQTMKVMERVASKNEDFEYFIQFMVTTAGIDLGLYNDVVIDVCGCSHCLNKEVDTEQINGLLEDLNKR